jgi:hypothetical protein
MRKRKAPINMAAMATPFSRLRRNEGSRDERAEKGGGCEFFLGGMAKCIMGVEV